MFAVSLIVLFFLPASTLDGSEGFVAVHFHLELHTQEEEHARLRDEALTALASTAMDEDQELQLAAFDALAKTSTSNPEVLSAVKIGLMNSSPVIRKSALRVVHRQSWDAEQKGRLLIIMLRSEDEGIRNDAVQAFVSEYQSNVIVELIEMLGSDDESQQTKSAIIKLITNNRDDVAKILPVLESIYPESSKEQKLYLLSSISRYGSLATTSLGLVTKEATSSDREIRFAAIECIGSILAERNQRSRQGRRSSSLDSRAQTYVDNLFKKYDKNKNGAIEGDETKELKVPIPDFDGNGVITKAEALRYVGGIR